MNTTDESWTHRLLATPAEIEQEMGALLDLRPLPPEPEPGSTGAAVMALILACHEAGMSEAEIRRLPRVNAYLSTCVSETNAVLLRDQAVGRCIVRRITASHSTTAAEPPLTLDQIRALAIVEATLAPIADDLKDEVIATINYVLQLLSPIVTARQQ